VQIEERLEDLGLELTALSGEKSKVAPAVRTGNLVFTSMCYSEERGKLGKDISASAGYPIAQGVAVQCLSAIKALIGDLDRISRVVKIQVFVNCEASFTDQVQVFHGATELLLDLFGEEAGWHARSAVGAAQLHDNAAVAMDMVVEIRDQGP
jgi:enamine deaminase RidA (YjgF/YER057c/UK114 family)